MSTDDNKQLVRQLIQALNDNRIQDLDELVGAQYDQDNPSVYPGRAGLKELFTRLRSAFPDLNVSITELVAEGDHVVAVTTMRGTQQGELPGIKPTGRSVNVSSMDLYRIQDNRIVEHFGRFDELGMLEQLGIAHDLEWPGSRQEPT
jgi:predicted ester cyclase